MKTLKLNKATMAKLASNDMKNIFGGAPRVINFEEDNDKGITITNRCDSVNTHLTEHTYTSYTCC